MNHGHLAEQHPDGVPEADPMQWSEVCVEDEDPGHCSSPFSLPVPLVDRLARLHPGAV
jgi:hypothetical protein